MSAGAGTCHSSSCAVTDRCTFSSGHSRRLARRGPERLLPANASGSSRPTAALRVSPKLPDAQRWLFVIRFHEGAVDGLRQPATSRHTIGQRVATPTTGLKYSRHRPTATRRSSSSKAVAQGPAALVDTGCGPYVHSSISRTGAADPLLSSEGTCDREVAGRSGAATAPLRRQVPASDRVSPATMDRCGQASPRMRPGKGAGRRLRCGRGLLHDGAHANRPSSR